MAQQRGDKLAADADRLETAASAGYERFAGGQPILLGYRSAASALRDRERADIRSCIARPTNSGFHGIYVHYDGYPSNHLPCCSPPTSTASAATPRP